MEKPLPGPLPIRPPPRVKRGKPSPAPPPVAHKDEDEASVTPLVFGVVSFCVVFFGTILFYVLTRGLQVVLGLG